VVFSEDHPGEAKGPARKSVGRFRGPSLP
jgi:hypothetical protein